MAVYTPVTLSQAQALANHLNLGTVIALSGIAGGIENTNYFLTVDRPTAPQEYVLTLFERLTHAQVPYYLGLMQHLGRCGVPVPVPVASASGDLAHTLCEKPACIVSKLAGKSELQPSSSHCAQLGGVLAAMHLGGQTYDIPQPNLRGLDWWNATAPSVLPHLNPGQADLLTRELSFQNHIALGADFQGLPRGAVHADLFRDNVMFEGDALSGVFDFYFAGTDTWLFDLAVVLNDWCVELTSGQWVHERASALICAYQSIRPLRPQERALLNAMLRSAALRFWISRLWDFHLPREASLLKAHDPSHFERILALRSSRFDLQLPMEAGRAAKT